MHPQDGGGNSAGRRKWRREAGRKPEPVVTHVSEERSDHSELRVSERILAFLDHSSIQTLAGIVGGLVGTFLDGRYFCVLCLLVSYGLHRSKALAGVAPRRQLSIHVFSMAVTGALLFFMGVRINVARPHVYTPSDYANAVLKNLPLPPNPIVQHITNTYKTYVTGNNAEIQSSDIQVYFGTPPDQMRGREVSTITDEDRKQLLLHSNRAGYPALLLSPPASQAEQEIPITIRNTSHVKLEHARVEIASTKMLTPLTQGSRIGPYAAVEYDLPDLPPFEKSGEEIRVMVKTGTHVYAPDECPILVTVFGKGLKTPHSEILIYAFVPIPG